MNNEKILTLLAGIKSKYNEAKKNARSKEDWAYYSGIVRGIEECIDAIGKQQI